MKAETNQSDFTPENEVVVVVPVYRQNPGPEELEAFKHNCRILKNHKIALVAPEGLNIDEYKTNIDFDVEFFPPHFFQNIAGYNRLMLSVAFYSRFKSYKYMLICQTDVFVFKNDLENWCRKGYDYVGAPWIGKPFFLFQYVLAKIGFGYAIKLLLENNLKEAVGNGGFSLRKISAFIGALEQNQLAKEWTANEDFYWSFFAKSNGTKLLKPPANEAALFCIELAPEKLMKQQNHLLPMGIHAWKRYNPEFWVKYINMSLKND